MPTNFDERRNTMLQAAIATYAIIPICLVVMGVAEFLRWKMFH
jgi:hypothetical protein